MQRRLLQSELRGRPPEQGVRDHSSIGEITASSGYTREAQCRGIAIAHRYAATGTESHDIYTRWPVTCLTTTDVSLVHPAKPLRCRYAKCHIPIELPP